MKGVKEKQIERGERTDGSARDEKQTGVKFTFVVFDVGSEPNRGQQNDGSEQDHDQAKPVETDGETQAEIGGNRERADVLKRTGSRIEAKIFNRSR